MFRERIMRALIYTLISRRYPDPMFNCERAPKSHLLTWDFNTEPRHIGILNYSWKCFLVIFQKIRELYPGYDCICGYFVTSLMLNYARLILKINPALSSWTTTQHNARLRRDLEIVLWKMITHSVFKTLIKALFFITMSRCEGIDILNF